MKFDIVYDICVFTGWGYINFPGQGQGQGVNICCVVKRGEAKGLGLWYSLNRIELKLPSSCTYNKSPRFLFHSKIEFEQWVNIRCEAVAIFKYSKYHFVFVECL